MLIDDQGGGTEDAGAFLHAGVAEAELSGSVRQCLALDDVRDLIEKLLAGDGQAGVQHDESRVEEIHQVGHARAEVAGDGGGDSSCRPVTSGRGGKGSPTARDGAETSDGFQAATGATDTERTAGRNASVTEFTGGTAFPIEEAPVDIEAGADAGAVINVDATGDGRVMFGHGLRAGAGFDEDRKPKCAVEDIAEREAVKEAYGLNDPVTASFGRRCLMARKLVEAGVRFVEIFTPSQSWDAHGDIKKNHEKNARETDKPIAALLNDLKQRGMLAKTLVVYMGEFGRTPDTPAEQETPGRDHNTRCQSMWFAGGGALGGSIIGTTDDIGHKAVENIYHMHDVHATILHLMGLNDMRLTYYFAGRNRRLTDLGGRLIKEILA